MAAAIVCWYGTSGRRFPWRTGRFSRWQLLMTEVLLQRTRADTVGRVAKLVYRQWPTAKSLALAPRGAVLQALRPLGLYRKRYRLLVQLAAAVADRRAVPNTRPELESLPGVGPYVAGAYLSAALGAPESAIDVNVARILERAFGPRTAADIRHCRKLARLANALIGSTSDPRSLNWGLLDIGFEFCRPRFPLCPRCPIAPFCQTGRGVVREVTRAKGG